MSLRRRAGRVFACVLAIAGGQWAVRAAEPEAALASRVIVLANSDDPDSLRIAKHYAEVRGVPAANLIALKMPLAESISWREFVATVWQPLLDQLVPAGWIDAIPMLTTDGVGRRKYAPHRHRIAALVVCRGVPLKIEHDPTLTAEVRPFTSRAEFRTNAGAVDGELALLALPNYPINAFVPNPLFQNERPSPHDLAQVVKVARLDGPTADDANALVDRAVAAERSGLIGRAYVDIANRDNLGDPWLENAAKQLAALGFDSAVDRDPGTMPVTARIDAPAFYFGWYSNAVDGPFRLPGFRFAPGAIALHIYSYSAATMRQANGAWTGALVARGVTATVGNVHEPYLHFTHPPHLLLRALARGANLADAACFALPALSWHAVLIGDPLYRPFAVPLDEQLAARAKLPPTLAPYAVLRRMRLLDAEGRRDEAISFGVSAQRETPGLVVGVALARWFLERQDKDAAGKALGLAATLPAFSANEWALVREAAQLLSAAERPGRAVELWRTLFAAAELPADLRIAWLPEALASARSAGDAAQAQAWQAELAAVSTPKGTK